MGDAAGIGPEIISKILFKKEIFELCRPLVIGDADVMEKALEITSIKLEINSIDDISDAKFEYGTIDVLDLDNILTKELKLGQISKMAGKAAVEYIEKAIELALENSIHAIVTAPINKEAINLAGYNYAGHTEILADLTNTKDVVMMLLAGPLRVIHVTTHVSLRKACDLVKKERILITIKLAYQTLRNLGFQDPKIAVAGLNPHAGEGGLFGIEEIEEIIPAIESARELGMRIEGPIPPDTVFVRAKKGEFDAVVAMYHDQGHIPIKLLGFEFGVNVTIGLPIIRTSVDHGTAFDIAGKGIANPQSLNEAIMVAVKLAERK